MRKPCCDKQDTNKGAWSKQEDQKLIDYVRKHGEGCWRTLPQAAGLLRCGKSCRLRWINYLRPDLKRGNFGEDEEDLIIKLHALLGNRWSLIAGRLPGRTDNEVKNYWNSHLRRKLMNMGVDPNNHRLTLQTSRFHNQEHNNNNLPIHKAALGSGGTPANQPVKICNDQQQVSDESCGCEQLPDLNLDLTITTPSSTSTYSIHNNNIIDPSSIHNNKTNNKHTQFGFSRDQAESIAPSSTLLLFH
ncbi:hypothetical protein HS088_TW07G00790 [Tripterygium wilfordii]|uniref:Uncharacterized protein n=1 Tax=Tripterygium wilfordii TaxID=458696 RepID=A0A7J7DG05_TRIWF|nr:myb-related protein 308-like [Tripterygium wilfordii]KAF5745208.1 hypothetical protein HS088_TW07G00790 [Tripterygium wilfordii]